MNKKQTTILGTVLTLVAAVAIVLSFVFDGSVGNWLEVAGTAFLLGSCWFGGRASAMQDECCEDCCGCEYDAA